MPIRFRCGCCNQLLGIARRKAGTVVTCPNCQQAVVVPHPEEEQKLPIASNKNSNLKEDKPALHRNEEFVFDRNDFEEIFRPVLEPRRGAESAHASTHKKAVPVAQDAPLARPISPATPLPDFSSGLPSHPDTVPTVIPVSGGASEIVLTQKRLVLLLASVIGGMILAFGGGVLVGLTVGKP